MIQLCNKRTAKYPANKQTLLNEDANSFYLLGAYMTDGNIRDQKRHISFSLYSKDLEWVQAIRDLMCPNKPIYTPKSYYDFSMSDIDMMNWLISYGCTPRKSKSLSITKSIPPAFQRDFVRGVVDGDGSIFTSNYSKKKNGKEYRYTKVTAYICSASLLLLQQIQNMIPKNINCYIHNCGAVSSVIGGRKVTATCDMYRLIFNDSNAKQLLKWIYYPEHQLSLPRKLAKANSVLNM